MYHTNAQPNRLLRLQSNEWQRETRLQFHFVYPIHWQSPISGVKFGEIYNGAKENGPSRANGWDVTECPWKEETRHVLKILTLLQVIRTIGDKDRLREK